jgi:hypothetical protein
MIRFRAWGVAAALSLCAAGHVAAADPPKAGVDGRGQDTRPWYKRMFFAPKPAGPAARGGAAVAVPGQPPVSATLSPELVHAALQAEQDAYLRRMLICTKLREAGYERNDDALLKQVEELERQADAIYKQRVAALGVSRSVRAPLPPTVGAVASFDLAPEKPTDPRAAAAKLTAPAAPVPASGTAEVREVKP